MIGKTRDTVAARYKTNGIRIWDSRIRWVVFLQEIQPEEMAAFDVSAPHTTHCLADGDIMISTMGDNSGNGKGDFILIDGKSKKIKGSE